MFFSATIFSLLMSWPFSQSHSPGFQELAECRFNIGSLAFAPPHFDANFAESHIVSVSNTQRLEAVSTDGRFGVFSDYELERTYLLQKIRVVNLDTSKILATFDFKDSREYRMKFAFLSSRYLGIDHGPTKKGTRIEVYDLETSRDSLLLANPQKIPFSLYSHWFDDTDIIDPPTTPTPGLRKIFGTSRNHRLKGEIWHRREGVVALNLTEFGNDSPLSTIDLSFKGVSSEVIFGAPHFEISDDGNRILLFLSSGEFLLFDSKSGLLIKKIRPSVKRFSSHWDLRIVRRLFSSNGAWLAYDGKIVSSTDLSPISILMPRFAVGEAPVDSWFDGNDLILMTKDRIYRMAMIRNPERTLSTPMEILSR